MEEVNTKRFQLNGIELTALVSGKENNPVIVFLHGFPICAHMWKPQLEFFSQQGFYVVAPEQRGYHDSYQSSNVADYQVDLLTADIAALIDQLGSPVYLVGHDWGGMIAWRVAALYPEKIKKLCVINCPHPYPLQAALQKNIRQIIKSLYMGFFQFPTFAAKCLRWKHCLALRKFLNFDKKNSFLSPSEQELQLKIWAQENTLTSMINWYRAARVYSAKTIRPRIKVPTLLIWSKGDPVFVPSLAEDSIALCENGELAMYDFKSHWLSKSHADLVNTRLLAFLSTKL